ncbi:hypothetical protein B4109_2916 [Geobacillus stearothermophilus]|uniref:Uncharacterized protein n=1 Tax=Geobacillus stearothermophilus TaxID=1422 RepID=A0A150M8X0_GEOSE|nr:hypothetical protein B4109_2916 [Geobacillus stearothermophilus]
MFSCLFLSFLFRPLPAFDYKSAVHLVKIKAQNRKRLRCRQH